MSKIPGVTARHAIITDDCRENRGDEGAFDEAVDRLREEYEKCLEGWSEVVGVEFHLVLTLQAPDDSANTLVRGPDQSPARAETKGQSNS